MNKVLLTITIFSLSALSLFAQDRIIKLDRSEINCKVSEIGITEIKYKKDPDGPIYITKKNEVYKIIFENGTEEILKQNDMAVVTNESARRYKRAITTRPFSLMTGYVCFGYQVALSQTRAFVSELGVIGPKVGPAGQYDDSGVYFRAGYRLKRTPEIILPGMEWGYNLGGFYIQPEIAVSIFNSKPTTSYSGGSVEKDVTSAAFIINIGRQMIFGDIFTFDIGAGLGYGSSNANNYSNNYSSYYEQRVQYYSHYLPGAGAFAATFSFSMGILLK